MKKIPQKMLNTPVGLSLIAGLFLTVPMQANVLLDHSFPADRDTQNLPTSSAWYKGGGGNVELNASSGSLSFNRINAGSHLVATNFVDTTAGYTLGVGEGIRMSYTFSPASVIAAPLNTDNRMGLFSYNTATDARLTADNSSANGPGAGVTGYMFTFHAADVLNENPFSIRKRTDVGSSSLLSSTNAFTDLGGANVVSPDGAGLTSGGTYTLQFTITRSEESVLDLNVAYLDAGSNIMASFSAQDTGDLYLTYDAFVYRASNVDNKGGAHNITGFTVEVIPEPSTYAVFVGLLGLGFVLYRRRR